MHKTVAYAESQLLIINLTKTGSVTKGRNINEKLTSRYGKSQCTTMASIMQTKPKDLKITKFLEVVVAMLTTQYTYHTKSIHNINIFQHKMIQIENISKM